MSARSRFRRRFTSSSLTSSGRGPAPRRRPTRCPLRVEPLESRTLLSAPAPLTSHFSGSGSRLGYAETAGSLSTFRGDTIDGKSSSGKITHNLLGTSAAEGHRETSGKAGLPFNARVDSGTVAARFNQTLKQGPVEPTRFGPVGSRPGLPRIEPRARRAVPAPIPTPTIYPNPFMAPNNFSEIHLNSYQTDTFSVPGPGRSRSQRVQQSLFNPPTQIAGSLAFDTSGQILSIRVGAQPRNRANGVAQTLQLIDPVTLKILDQVPLPPRPPSKKVSFSGGGYFYLANQDNQDQGRVVCVTTTQQIRIYTIQNNQFVDAQDPQTYDLSKVITTPGDLLNSVLPDKFGNLWFISHDGVVGYVDPATGAVHSTTLTAWGGESGEEISKSFATDGDGGVYVVSDYALYRFQLGSEGVPTATWRTVYDRGNRTKPGQNQQGSGTTPTLFDDFAGNQFVTIADNADPFMHINVYNRQTGALVAQKAVFRKLPRRNDTENSLIAVNHSVLVENNYGNRGIASTLGSLTTRPGIARVDFDPATGRARDVWTNYGISVPSIVSQLSTADGLEYTYAKDAQGWYWAALNFQTGKIVATARVGLSSRLGGAPANNFYGGLEVGPDGSAYAGVFGGIVAWRP